MTPSPAATVLLDLRRLQRQSVKAELSALQALLAAAPEEVRAQGSVAYLSGESTWAASPAAPLLLSWWGSRRRRVCLSDRLAEALLPALLDELGQPRRCSPCLEAAAWLWDAPPDSENGRGLEPSQDPADGPLERLAWFSPLPPQASGISDYSVALLPKLARHFHIDVVADPASTALPVGARAVIAPAQFERDRDRYPHLLYQVGNSTLHLEHLHQLRRDPGAVVLHDFFLSHGLCSEDADAVLGGDVLQRLYRSHGFPACHQHFLGRQREDDQAIWRYPCNLEPLQWASGVIVHSRESTRLAQQFYGTDASADWSVVPHLKGLAPPSPPQRAAGRAALALAEDSFVVCSFGFLGMAKLTDRLLQGFLASSLAQDPKVVFVFAGSEAGNRSLRLQLGRAVAEASRQGQLQAQVRFTGWIARETYRQYLVAADGAIQLRTSSRGETSGTVLDCMGAGLPLIVNDHGSMRELPEQTVLRLVDPCSIADIARGLERLRDDDDLRDRLRQRSLAHVAEHHAPDDCARRYAAAIRFASGQTARRRRWLEATAPLVAAGLDPVLAANSLARLQPPRPRLRQLLLDVSIVARADLGSGVQRVVRAISEQLLRHPPVGFRVEPVRASEDGQGYRYARRFALELLQVPDQAWDEPPIDAQEGDLFLGIDLDQAGVVRQRGYFQLLRALGVTVQFVVHDLLPCQQPQYFPPGAADWHRAWLDVVSSCDGALCVSRSVADDLRQWLRAHPPAAGTEAFAVNWFHHGSDFCPSSAPLSASEIQLLDAVPRATTLLMVGTLEPRKGYLDVIEAATLLWREGASFNLVIVGREGWSDLPDSQRRTIPRTLARLRRHPLRDRRLFWFASASDALLQALYGRADGLIGASYGEGFGIPLIEAARAGLPLLVRDLPVFREVTAGRASFFPLEADSPQLAAALATFVNRLEGGSSGIDALSLPSQSWRQSAAQVVQALGLRWQENPGAAELVPVPPPVREPAVQRQSRRRLRQLKGLLRRLRNRLKRLVAPLPAAEPLAPDQSLIETAQPWLQDLVRLAASQAPTAR